LKKLRLKPSDFSLANCPCGQFFQMALASEPKRSELFKKHPPNETDALALGDPSNETDATASG
jgi:hypothetical protein